MASQNRDEATETAARNRDETTVNPDRITFELERLKLEGKHQLVVRGRWFGVRGRRFMRPTLTLISRSDGRERRALADLEHKPWAAEDGELWIAAFRIPVALDEAAQLELSVAPDVAIELPQAQSGAQGARAGATVSGAPDARAPRVRTDRVPARPSAADREFEIERLKDRLATAEREIEREHAKRQAADQALEEERSQALKLRSEVGNLRVQLDLAAAIRSELDATAAELDATRNEAREAETRLEVANQALDKHRAAAQRLREQLTAAEAAIQRLSQARETADRYAGEAGERQRQAREDETVKMPVPRAGPVRPVSPAGPADSPASPASPASPRPLGPLRPLGRGRAEPATRELDEPAPTRRPRPQLRAEPEHQRPARPLNPSLRSRRWLGRLVALIVMCGVIAAIVIVIHSAMPSFP